MTVYGKRQSTLDDYAGFVEKFRPKKTTDDCYTPEPVYDVVLAWAAAEYGFDPATVVRPFFPGGDFEREDYEGRVVVDNPPFSILARVLDFFEDGEVPYFLWAPHLTVMGTALKRPHACALMCGVKATYHNGANVVTSFVTSMDDARVRTVPDLRIVFEEADTDAAQKRAKTAHHPVIEYPDEVMRQTDFSQLSRGGEDFRLYDGEFCRVSALDAQRPKSIFGGGVLMSERKAAEKRAAEKRAAEKREKNRFALSEREREIVRALKD